MCFLLLWIIGSLGAIWVYWSVTTCECYGIAGHLVGSTGSAIGEQLPTDDLRTRSCIATAQVD
jgi:hypothetical protein